MRYDKGHKGASQERILKAAARQFRRDGIAATGITGIMGEAGLTNGAFYSHFESRDELVCQGLERTLDEQLQSLAGSDASADVVQLIEAYLTAEHRDQPEWGCGSAAMLPEIARQPPKTREAYTTKLRKLIQEVARRLPGGSESAEAQSAAIGIFGTLVGTLQLARAVDDAPLSDAILAAGCRAATALARSPQSSDSN